MKKILSLLLVLVIVFSITVRGDKTKNMTAEEIMTKATEQSTNWENFDAEFDMKMKAALMGPEPMEINVVGTATYFMKPNLKVKMRMSTEMGEGMSMEIEQYMIQDGEQFIMYQQVMGQWQKVVMDNLIDTEMLNMDPAENLELFMKYLKSAEIVAEEQIAGKDTYKINLIVSFDMYKELIASNPQMDVGQLDGTGILEALSEAGDMEYTVWVEKESLQAIRYEMDFGDIMAKVGAAMAEMTEMGEEAAQIYENMEMFVTMTMTNINTAEEFEVPEEALAAPEISF